MLPYQHLVDFLQSIPAKRCRSHTVHILGVNLLQYGTKRFRSAVVTFIHQYHPVFPELGVEFSLFAQGARHGNVHDAGGGILGDVDDAHNAFSPLLSAGFCFVFRQILPEFQKPLQCLLPLLNQCGGFQQNEGADLSLCNQAAANHGFAECRGGAEDAAVVLQNSLYRRFLIVSQFSQKANLQRFPGGSFLLNLNRNFRFLASVPISGVRTGLRSLRRADCTAILPEGV